ncbi:hypothetical protein BN14_07248 [Rhizoctonia solani AG-1 IB]|uniref:Uncharacterized protein n=1 Tax=Thanatephorus cucumeris (strain AG1-IB / isolate 7/3/14) TaxID=1108050 RepID=M5C143_THACB|nr:hypothetical protein BN14_07248 [Rhizoctonia solani AG-1 IB]
MSSANSAKQGATGSRLAEIITYAKTLLQKDTYVSGFRNGVLTVVSVLSIFALYWVMVIVWARNAIQSFKGRKTSKTSKTTAPKPSPSNVKPVAKPTEDIGLNMDDVQEIPGEGELAVKEDMPSRDQIPEIEDEPQAGSSDEREPAHVTSDDDTTLIGQDELVSIKGSQVVVPIIKHDFERPISPPATPPTEATDLKTPTIDVVESLQVNSVPDVPVAPVIERHREDAKHYRRSHKGR